HRRRLGMVQQLLVLPPAGRNDHQARQLRRLQRPLDDVVVRAAVGGVKHQPVLVLVRLPLHARQHLAVERRADVGHDQSDHARPRSSSATWGCPFSTRDTVAGLTPAALAMSRTVAIETSPFCFRNVSCRIILFPGDFSCSIHKNFSLIRRFGRCAQRKATDAKRTPPSRRCPRFPAPKLVRPAWPALCSKTAACARRRFTPSAAWASSAGSLSPTAPAARPGTFPERFRWRPAPARCPPARCDPSPARSRTAP